MIINNVYDLIYIIVALVITIACIISLFVVFVLSDLSQKEYIKNLNEHDKAVVLDFIKSQNPFCKRKEK